MYILGPCGSLERPLLGGWEFLMLSPLPPMGVFSQWFEALFPCTGALGCVVCLAPQLFLLADLRVNVELPSPPAAALPRVLSAWLPISALPTGVYECFFFNSLVVGLPYSPIFCQFWLLFVFKFVILLLVVRGGPVCLPTPPSRPEVLLFFLKKTL